jgi:pyruvate formate lyase activating enzyme
VAGRTWPGREADLQAGIVFDIKKFSVHDGPGIRTTVFLKGCPLSCWWCHNPESQSFERERLHRGNRCIRCGACVEACDHGAISWQPDGPLTEDGLCTLCGACVDVCHAEARTIVGQSMTVEEVMAEIGRDRIFYEASGGGVTFSGGEPLSQPRFLLALLQACKEQEMHTVLDTCGYAPWATVERVAGLVDLWLYDLKIVDDARHREMTGVSNRGILANLRALSDLGRQIVVRVPVVPGVNDDTGSIGAIGQLVSGLSNVIRVELLPYHRTASEKYARLERPYALEGVKPPPNGRLFALANALEPFGKPVKIGGLVDEHD